MKQLVALFFVFGCAQAPLRSPATYHAAMDEWNFWPHEQEGCGNSKDKFLEKTSTIKVSYTRKLNFPCNVEKGRWKDFFTGEELNRAEDAIVTTIVPLAHLRRKNIQKMPLVRLLSMVRDENYFIVLKKGGAGEALYLQNNDLPQAVPESSPGKCEFWGMWKEMKEKWTISQRAREKKLVAQASVECETSSAYDRKAWKHWSVLPGQQCDSRLEVLLRSSREEPKFVSSEKQETNKCTKIESGAWPDPYTGLTFTDPRTVDVDHFVPLMHAYISGGWRWPQWKKELYANYQNDPLHLLAVSASENRKKGARHPGLYMPPSESFHCDYLTQWAAVKLRWGMSIAMDEYTGITALMEKCPESVQKQLLDVLELLKTPPGVNQHYQ